MNYTVEIVFSTNFQYEILIYLSAQVNIKLFIQTVSKVGKIFLAFEVSDSPIYVFKYTQLLCCNDLECYNVMIYILKYNFLVDVCQLITVILSQFSNI